MATILSQRQISELLKQQQETIDIIDKYIHRWQPDANLKFNYYDNYANLVMQHIFLNIKNSYQDGIFISQGLIDSVRYYKSTALSHAQRVGQEFLIDLAYIMRDRKNKLGYEYLRYLKLCLIKRLKNLVKTTYLNPYIIKYST